MTVYYLVNQFNTPKYIISECKKNRNENGNEGQQEADNKNQPGSFNGIGEFEEGSAEKAY